MLVGFLARILVPSMCPILLDGMAAAVADPAADPAADPVGEAAARVWVVVTEVANRAEAANRVEAVIGHPNRAIRFSARSRAFF